MNRPDQRRGSATLAMIVTLALGVAAAAIHVGAPASAANASPIVDQLNLSSPQVGDEAFGDEVTVLPNGNYVVTDPDWDDGATVDVGAVYLYNGATNTVISTLTGTLADDRVGSGGTILLSNGNYVVSSPSWNNGLATDAGAVTWGNGATGITGTVSSANSLVGTSIDDFVSGVGVVALSNGNYVVRSPSWDNGPAAADAGAATWGNGTTGTTGTVSAANSLVGTGAGHFVTSGGVAVLSNGNYVVRSPSWDNGLATDAGAVTWGNGATGITGTVSAANSLVGTSIDDNVGSSDVIALTNGNYVVAVPFWNNGAATNAGAATWGNGTTGTTGPIATTNSLVGTSIDDNVSSSGVIALTNGNYVVNSQNWDNGPATNAGAATWGNGTTGTTGPVTTSNSLVGTSPDDNVGAAIALTNGNYVVNSPNWDNGPATANAGAATWGNGTTGTTGAISAANSLIGTSIDDNVSSSGVIALTNGNYVVNSQNWDNGPATNAGAATWGNGTTGTTGTVSAANSLVGTSNGNRVASTSTVALTNGNYVVRSPSWDNGPATNAGAATWGNGATGTTGTVSAANSLVGATNGDSVSNGGVLALTNGNYVVRSPLWDNGASNVGAVTWGNGTTGTTGAISAANSLIGTNENDNVGAAIALTNGNYVVNSPDWDNGPAAADAGAATWGNGTTGTTGAISAANSLIGTNENDNVGSGGAIALANGNYVVGSPSWDNGAATDAGAVTFGLGSSGATGSVTSSNSAIGTPPGDLGTPDPLLTADDALVLPTASNRVVLLRLDLAPFFPTPPANVTAATPAGASSATVTFATPVAADRRDVSPPVTVCTPASGTAFPVGATTVTCSATDTAGSTGTTAFEVTVTATPTVPPTTPPTTPPVPPMEPASVFSSLPPERFVDTRTVGATLDDAFEAEGKRAPDSEYRVQITGRGGVPDGATAAIVNITAIQAEGNGFVTAHPCVTPRPLASSLNYTADVNLGNEIIAPLTASGELCLYTFAASHLTVDVTGYVDAASPLTPTTPARFLDTRPGLDDSATIDGDFIGGPKPGPGTTITLEVAERGDIPADVAAIIVNVTAIQAERTGFITVHPCLEEPPNAASLNYVAGVNRGNELVANLDPDGNICLFTSATTHIAADIVGYLPAGTDLSPIGPARLLDTRATGTSLDGASQAEGKRDADTEYTLQVAGRGTIPGDATSAVVNITAIQAERTGFITVHPCLADRPNTASLNFTANVNGGNEIITQLDANGRICIYTSGSVHLTADIVAAS